MLEGVLKDAEKNSFEFPILFCFNPWYVGGGVKRYKGEGREGFRERVSILGMLEGVLKAAE